MILDTPGLITSSSLNKTQFILIKIGFLLLHIIIISFAYRFSVSNFHRINSELFTTINCLILKLKRVIKNEAKIDMSEFLDSVSCSIQGLIHYFIDLTKDMESVRRKFKKKSSEIILLEEKTHQNKTLLERRKSGRLSNFGTIR